LAIAAESRPDAEIIMRARNRPKSARFNVSKNVYLTTYNLRVNNLLVVFSLRNKVLDARSYGNNVAGLLTAT